MTSDGRGTGPDSATVLLRESVERGYGGGLSELRAFLRTLRPAAPTELLVRFETAMSEQLQVDWVEFRKGEQPLHAFCAMLATAGRATCRVGCGAASCTTT